MSETFWKGEPVENMHRDVLVEILRQQHFRIEALEAALEKSDALGKYWQARAIKAEGIPAALAPEQDK